jgi:FtsH-binding integral membrane protein
VLAAGALLHVATVPMSQAHQQAAEAERTSVVLAWQAAQGVFDAMLVTGALLLPVAVTLFGVVLRHDLGAVVGWGGVAVGTAGIAGAVVAAAAPPSPLVAVSILGALAFHLVAGIGCLRLSRR